VIGPVKHRMYVDEVGNPDLKSSYDPRHRHLSLTGVVFELSYVDAVLFPRLEELKRTHFGSHVDEPTVMHRKELLNARPPFGVLRDREKRAQFDADFLSLLRDLDYTVVTVVIDKQAHAEHYREWHHDPYHYCMQVLLERYVMWLDSEGATGDVMAESRGGKEDMRLKRSFARLCEEGTGYVSAEALMVCLTSRQLKVKLKANNIAGLQIADLVAHPSFRATVASHEGEQLADNFGGRIARLLEEGKYRRSPSGQIDGWGRKWLP